MAGFAFSGDDGRMIGPAVTLGLNTPGAGAARLLAPRNYVSITGNDLALEVMEVEDTSSLPDSSLAPPLCPLCPPSPPDLLSAFVVSVPRLLVVTGN